MAFESYEMTSTERKTPHTYEEDGGSGNQLATQMGYTQQLQEKFGLISMIGFSCQCTRIAFAGLLEAAR